VASDSGFLKGAHETVGRPWRLTLFPAEQITGTKSARLCRAPDASLLKFLLENRFSAGIGAS